MHLKIHAKKHQMHRKAIFYEFCA